MDQGKYFNYWAKRLLFLKYKDVLVEWLMYDVWVWDAMIIYDVSWDVWINDWCKVVMIIWLCIDVGKVDVKCLVIICLCMMLCEMSWMNVWGNVMSIGWFTWFKARFYDVHDVRYECIRV